MDAEDLFPYGPLEVLDDDDDAEYDPDWDDADYEVDEDEDADADEDDIYFEDEFDDGVSGDNDEDEDMEPHPVLHRLIVRGGGDSDEADSDEEQGSIHEIGRMQLLELLELINSASGMSANARSVLIQRMLGGAQGLDLAALTRPRRQTDEERAAERKKRRWWEPQIEPHPKGLALLRSGLFGPVPPWQGYSPPKSKTKAGSMSPSGTNVGSGGDEVTETASHKKQRRLRPSERSAYRHRRGSLATANMAPASAPVIPNTNGTVVATYPSVPYVGQFAGPDYSVFYTATQDFMLHLYDMTKATKTRPRGGRVGGMGAGRGSGRGTRGGSGSGGAGMPGAYLGQRGADDDDDDDEEADLFDYRYRNRRTAYTDDTSMRKLKSVRGVDGQWTITDADCDRKGERIIYSSITPYVHLLKTSVHEEEHTQLDFTVRSERSLYGHSHFGIWSIRFSADGKEIVAGIQDGKIMVYDIEADRRVLSVQGHKDDVNAVCFADESSTNILVSGSDDGYVKVWDRRSLGSSRPMGVLVGATEGITYASPKGDGRYVVVNSKDQAARLYDLRNMRQWSDFETEPDAVVRWGQPRFDYRGMRYLRPRHLAHPRDCSVMTFRGHSVLRTLIRCHFSPRESTGQSYIYSGSADGLIHIWSLDGRVVQVLNRADSVPLRDASGGYNDPSAPEPHRAQTHYGADAFDMQGVSWTVRDVSWHGYEPTLMSTCWEVEGRYHRHGGSVAKHEWKGLGKGGITKLEDWVERESAEATETRRGDWEW